MVAALKVFPAIFAVTMSFIVFVFPEPKDLFSYLGFLEKETSFVTVKPDYVPFISEGRLVPTTQFGYTFYALKNKTCSGLPKKDKTDMGPHEDTNIAWLAQRTYYQTKIGQPASPMSETQHSPPR